MKTLLVSDNFPPRTGGSGRWFWEIYRRLPREEFAIAAGEDPRQEAFDRTHDLDLVRVPLTLPQWGLRSLAGLRGYGRSLRRLGPLLREKQVRRLHCGRCLPEGLMALAFKLWNRVPYLCYAHGEELNYGILSRELGWLLRRVVRGADFVIANSRNTQRLLQGDWGLPPERVALLHPGVDTQQFVPAERDAAVRARLGWGDRPVVLTVGRLQKRKGHDVMIAALSAVRKAVPDVLYAIVGDGEERPLLEGLVQGLGLEGHVQLRGEADDAELVRCYQQCDLFVLPNRQVGMDIEGFGMVLLEAQACGRPVVAGASGGTAETMRPGETGYVVPCDGPDRLAARVAGLLADRAQRTRMGAAARQWVVEQFDWLALSQQAAQLFDNGATLLAGRWAEAIPS